MRKVGFVIDSTFTYQGNDDVSIVPLKVIMDGKEYVEGTFDNQVVIDALEKGLDIKTSQPTPNSYVEAYEKQLEKYDHVICLTISATLSGTINGANVAKDVLDNKNVTVIDTMSATMGSSYVIEEVLAFAETGKGIDEVIAFTHEVIQRGSVLFSVDNLNTLVKNGRLGRVSAIIGGLLRVKPILRFQTGVLTVESKARGIIGVYKYITEQVKELLEKGKVVVRIGYVDNIDYARQIEKNILALESKEIDVKVTGIVSTVMAAHVGLGGMGIYLGSK